MLTNDLFVLSLGSKISKLPCNKNDKDSMNVTENMNGIV